MRALVSWCILAVGALCALGVDLGVGLGLGLEQRTDSSASTDSDADNPKWRRLNDDKLRAGDVQDDGASRQQLQQHTAAVMALARGRNRVC